MQSQISFYSCRYIPRNSHIYVVRKADMDKKRVQTLQNGVYYTIPFQNKFTKEVSNVVLGYACPVMCMQLCKSLKEDDCDCECKKLDVSEFQEICSNHMKMPLAVILNSFCDIDDKQEHYEIFFSGKYSLNVIQDSNKPNHIKII